MRIQFAFGNPRKKKPVKAKRKKNIAKRQKTSQSKKVRRAASRLRRLMAKSKKRNPYFRQIVSWKDKSGKSYKDVRPWVADGKEIEKLKKAGLAQAAKAKSAKSDKERKKAIKTGAEISRKIRAAKQKLEQERRDLMAYPAGATAVSQTRKSGKRKAASVSKKRKKKSVKKSVKKASRKVSRKAKRKVSRKVKRSSKRRSRRLKIKRHSHSRKLKHIKKGSVFSGVLKKRGKKKAGDVTSIAVQVKKNPRRKKSRRAKRYKHSHASKTLHVKKGSHKRFKKSGFKFNLKFNPGGAMKKAVDQAKEIFLGQVSNRDLMVVAIGGAITPVANKLVSKLVAQAQSIPGVSTVINSTIGLADKQGLGGPVALLLAAGAVNAGNKYLLKSNKHVAMIGEGLALSAVMGAAMVVGQKVAEAAGLSGILYTPNMSGINYTPNPRGMGILPTPMGSINYTPNPRGMGIMPTLNGEHMGDGPDFGKSADYGGSGGYTQEHKFSAADFGRDGSMDSDVDEDRSEDDIDTTGMGMG